MNNILLENYSKILIFFPIILITGPFLSDLFVSISSLIFIYLFVIHKIELKVIYKVGIFLIFFWVLFVINSLLSNNVLISLKSSFFSFRFFLFSFLVFYIFSKDLTKINKFNNVLKFLILFLCIDALFQYVVGFNFFGFTKQPRLSGVFENEWILGSFLSKIYALMITLSFLEFEKNFSGKKNVIFNVVLLLLVYITVILTFERAAFVFLNLYIFLVIILLKKLRKFLIIGISILLLLNTIFLLNIDHYKNRYIKNFISLINFKNGNFLLIRDYSDMFKTSYEIFKNNKTTGVGNKNFINACKKYLSKFPKGCSNHPHNYYAQLMSENGIPGLIFLSFSLLYFFFLLFRYLNSYDFKYKNFCISSCVILILILQPMTTTGNFFNNWNAIIISLIFGFSLIRYKFNHTKL